MFISISICMFILFFMCLFTYLFTSEYTLYLAEWNKNHQLQHSWNVRPFGDDSLDPKSHSSDVTVMSLQFMYPLVNLQKKLWKITMFNGKTHYKWPFSIAMLVYQRVCILTVLISHDIPVNIPWKSIISEHIPMLYQWYPTNSPINLHSIPIIVWIVYEHSHGTGWFIIYNSPTVLKKKKQMIWGCPHRKPPQKNISMMNVIPWNSTKYLTIFPWNIPINIWLVVDPPLWKIWVRQLGWWHSQLNGKS